MTTNNAINNLPNSGIYQQAYWVSQFTGSDSNAGTSINTPFQTVQHVMGIAGTTPTIIYVVDANNNNNENISTTGAGQTIFIAANGTSFQGTITQAANDQLIMDNFAYIDSYTNNSSSPTYLTGNNLNIETTSTASNFINVGQYAGFHTGGGTLFINCNELNSITCDGSITSYIDAPFSQNISNAGTMNLHTLIPPASCITSNTGTITGFVGGTILGNPGVGPSTAAVPAFTWPNTDGTNGQVPTTNGSGVVSWADGGGGGGSVLLAPTGDQIITGSNTLELNAGKLYIGDPGGFSPTGNIVLWAGGAGNNPGATFTIAPPLNSNNATDVAFNITGGTISLVNQFNYNNATINAIYTYGSSTAPGSITSGHLVEFSNAHGCITIEDSGIPASSLAPPVAYQQTFWVSQNTGNDSNSGTSITSPFQTVQHAITTAAGTPTVIYVVDGNNSNTETITTLGASQILYLVALGTTFDGSFTVSATDSLYTDVLSFGNGITLNTCFFVGNVKILSGNLTATASSVYLICQNMSAYIGDSSTNAFINCASGGTFTLTGGTLDLVGPATTLILNSSPTVHLNSPTAVSVAGDGTGTITGIAGNTIYGGGPTFSFANGAGVFGYTIPMADGTNGQVITTNGSGAATWQTPAGASFNYPDALWVSQNGNDSNLGTNINSPFVLIQHAVTTAGNTETNINIPDYILPNSENIVTTGFGQLLFIDSPAVDYNGSITCTLGDQISLNAADITTLNHDDSHYSSFYHVDDMGTLNLANNGGIFMLAGVVGGATLGTNALATISSPGGIGELIVGSGTIVSASIGYGVGTSPPAVSNSGVIYGRIGCVDYGPMSVSSGGFYTVSTDANARFDNLSTAAKVNVIVAEGTNPPNLAQYKITNIYLNSNGTNFSGGPLGNRNLALTDGTTVYTVIPAATLQALSTLNAAWGSASVPFPVSSAINTLTQPNANLYLQYSGGTTDYTAGSVFITVEYARVV